MTSGLPGAAEIAALSAPAPRYTSYPSVPRWSSSPPPGVFAEALASLRGEAAVYVHVPFCWVQCDYCGCNMVVSRRQAAGDRYLAAMERQVRALPLGEGRHPIGRLHLGGGTPTWLSPHQLERLLALLMGRFEAVDGAELSVEVHPHVTRLEHLQVLARHGFRRLSIGVQSVDAQVLKAIGRDQDPEDVVRVVRQARELGFEGINLDLVYGLPHQSQATLDRTLEAVLQLRPERMALYGYAHLPWLLPNQAKIDSSALPGPVERVELFTHASEVLRESGYVALGLDHFARHDDNLAVAAASGTLSRDFMGYTDRTGPLIGLGPSAISELEGAYVQQPSHLGAWYRAVEGDDPLPAQRWCALTDEDELRRDAIRTVMCHLELDWKALGSRHQLADVREHLGVGPKLAPWIERGAVVEDEEGIRLTELGRLLARNIAACFDAGSEDGPAPWRKERAAG